MNVVDMDNTQISHSASDNDASDNDNDSDWEPSPNPTPEHGGPLAMPVDPASVVARFREQVRETLTPRGRADKRGTSMRSYFLFSTSTSTGTLCFGSKLVNVDSQKFTIGNCLFLNRQNSVSVLVL